MDRQKPRPDSQVETFVLHEPSLRARFTPERYDFGWCNVAHCAFSRVDSPTTKMGPTAVAQVLHRLSHGKNAPDLTQHSSGAVGPSAIAAQQE
jgi:hypothetical protein